MGPSSAATFGAPFELQTTGRTHLLVSCLVMFTTSHDMHCLYVSPLLILTINCFLQAARNQQAVAQWVSVIKEKMLPEAK